MGVSGRVFVTHCYCTAGRPGFFASTHQEGVFLVSGSGFATIGKYPGQREENLQPQSNWVFAIGGARGYYLAMVPFRAHNMERELVHNVTDHFDGANKRVDIFLFIIAEAHVVTVFTWLLFPFPCINCKICMEHCVESPLLLFYFTLYILYSYDRVGSVRGIFGMG